MQYLKCLPSGAGFKNPVSEVFEHRRHIGQDKTVVIDDNHRK